MKASIAWLAETKNAHHVAVTKPNQPTARAQPDSSTGTTGQHTASNAGHGRREPHSIETLAMADSLAGTAFPPRGTRPVRPPPPQGNRAKESRETVHAVTGLGAHRATPAELASYLRGH